MCVLLSQFIKDGTRVDLREKAYVHSIFCKIYYILRYLLKNMLCVLICFYVTVAYSSVCGPFTSSRLINYIFLSMKILFD